MDRFGEMRQRTDKEVCVIAQLGLARAEAFPLGQGRYGGDTPVVARMQMK